MEKFCEKNHKVWMNAKEYFDPKSQKQVTTVAIKNNHQNDDINFIKITKIIK